MALRIAGVADAAGAMGPDARVTAAAEQDADEVQREAPRAEVAEDAVVRSLPVS